MEYEIIIDRDVQIEMRDGAVLFADVYRPALNRSPVVDRFPTILVRTSYDKEPKTYAMASRVFRTGRKSRSIRGTSAMRVPPAGNIVKIRRAETKEPIVASPKLHRQSRRAAISPDRKYEVLAPMLKDDV